MFEIRVESIEDVSRRLYVVRERDMRTVRTANPYIAHMSNQNTRLFESSRGLKSTDNGGARRCIKGELAGAIMLRGYTPHPESPYNVPVALPIRGTHDNRGYVCISVPMEQLDQDLLNHSRKQPDVVALHVASQGVHGYLTGEITARALYVAENTQHLSSVFLQRFKG